jgi:hypothetical protein
MPEYIAYVAAPRAEASRLEQALESEPLTTAVNVNETKSTAEVEVQLSAPSFVAATQKAVDPYARLRAAAGLEELEPLYGFVGPAA